MKRLFVPVFAMLVCLTAIGAEAIAGVLWTADWTPGTNSVISDSGKNKINFTNQTPIIGEGTSNVVAARLDFQLPIDGTNDAFTHQNYSMSLKLTDNATGKSITKVFSGDLHGPLTPKSSLIDNTFNAPASFEFDLGDGHYKVTLNQYTAPGIPDGQALAGSFGARIEATPYNGEEPPNETPEPTSLVLAGLGVAGLGMRAWRKRKLFTA